MITFKDLVYFVTVANLNSVSATAEELYVSQPAVSASIKKIEAYFHTVLFEREKQGLILTAHGQELLACAQRLLALQNRLLAACQELKTHTTLNIVVPKLSLYKSIVYLARLMLNKMYPDLTVNITEYAMPETPSLQDFSFICFSPQIVGEAFNKKIHQLPNIKVQPFMTDSFCLIINRKNIFAKRNRPFKIKHLVSIYTLKMVSSFDEAEVIAVLKQNGYHYDGPIMSMNAYDEILNLILTDLSYCALLPRNFIMPYHNYLYDFIVVDLNIVVSQHFIAYNSLDFACFPAAQSFLDIFFTEVQKYV